MIIAKNDENKRSRIWRIVTLVTSILIVIVGIFLLTKLFTTNPLEGKWEDEDGAIVIDVQSNGKMTATVPDLTDEEPVDVELSYTMDKDAKVVTIEADEAVLKELADDSDGQFDQLTLENALDGITSTFDYSVDRDQLTLTEREYGDQFIFVEK